MSPKKVLIVTYYWPPSGGAGVQRFLKFCKYLPKFDIDPSILTVANPTYPILDSSLEREIPPDTKIYKTRTIEPFSIYSKLTGTNKSEATKPTIALKPKGWKSKISIWIRANLFIPDARLGWTFSAKSKAFELMNKFHFDAIITTGPPHSSHFVGKYLKKKTGVRWIADFRDPWSEIHYNQVFPRISLAKVLDRKFEKSVLKNADEVVVISTSMKNIQQQVVKRDYRVIPNGFDPDDFDIHGSKSNQNEVFTIRFVGSVREAAIPEALYKALAKLPDNLDFRLEYIGNVHPHVKEIVSALRLQDKVIFKPYVPHAEAVRAMEQADLLLLSISKTVNAKLILTGKLFDYIGARRPILFIGPTDGDAAKIIKDLKIGTCFEHGDVSGLYKYFIELLGHETKIKKIKSLDLQKHPFSRITLTRQLADLIKQKSPH